MAVRKIGSTAKIDLRKTGIRILFEVERLLEQKPCEWCTIIAVSSFLAGSGQTFLSPTITKTKPTNRSHERLNSSATP